jgi:archaellum component FlaC
MADETPLTIPNLIAALKEAGFVTKDDLVALREEIKEDTLNTLAQFYEGQIKPEIGEVRTEIQMVKNELSWVKDEIKGLKADMADTPTRREFEGLKQRVERLEQVN